MKTTLKKIYFKREEIDKIISQLQKYSFNQLKRHKHFEFSIMEKITDLELIKTTFESFSIIKSIELRENDKCQEYFGINYELPDKTFVVIAISFNTEPPTIINAFHAKKSYKNFERSLRKNYSNKFV